MGVHAPGQEAIPSPLSLRVAAILPPLVGSHSETIGQWLVFTAQVFYFLPLTIRQVSSGDLTEMNGLAWGRGSLVVDGGVISVLVSSRHGDRGIDSDRGIRRR